MPDARRAPRLDERARVAPLRRAKGIAATTQESPSADDLRDAWPALDAAERLEGLNALPRAEVDDFWLRLLAPDDVVDVLQTASDAEREVTALLDEATRREVTALLA